MNETARGRSWEGAGEANTRNGRGEKLTLLGEGGIHFWGWGKLTLGTLAGGRRGEVR